MHLPRVSSPGCGALLLGLLVAAALAGCGDGGQTAASTGDAQDVAQAEARATRQEAEAQALREQLRRLEAAEQQGARAPAGGAAKGDSGSGSGSGDTPVGQILPAAVHESFDALARSLPGEAGLAVSGVGAGQPVEQLGSLQSAIAWSTSKVPVAMAAIEAGVGSSQDLRAAITASDNAAATNLWNALGGGSTAAAAATAQLRAAGDTTTTVEARTLRAGYTPFGQTLWALGDQVRFTAGMACLDVAGEVLGLMQETIPAQRWGLGAADVPAELKGGWGPGSQPGTDGGYLDRQMGVMTIDGTPLAVAIAARPSDGSHTTGTSMLTQLAQWVAANARLDGLPARPSC